VIARFRKAVAVVLGAAAALCVYLAIRFAIAAVGDGAGDLGREGTVLFGIGSTVVGVVLGLGSWALWRARRT
jgi:hypothetical protein